MYARTCLPEPRTAIIRVLLVEDHVLVRRATKLLLQQDPQVTVVGEADDMADALRMIEEEEPDVAVLDIRLKTSSGIDLAKAIRQSYPWVKILVLTAFNYEQYARALVKVGIEGYLLKDVSGAELLQAIHASVEGRAVKSADAGTRLITGGQPRGSAYGTLPRRRLTARELEILEMLQGALTNHEIAGRLRLSAKTIHTHVSHILYKLGQPTSDGAVGQAVAVGLLNRVNAAEDEESDGAVFGSGPAR